MKKLLFINQTLSWGGAEVFNSDLLIWLHKSKQWDIKAFVTQPKLHETLVKGGVSSCLITTIVDVIGNKRGLLKGIILLPGLFLQYFRIINEHKNTDIVFMTGFIEKILVTPIAKSFNIRVVWSEFAPLDSIFKKFLGFPRFLYSLVEKMPDLVIAPTQNTSKHLLQNTNIPDSKIILIPLARQVSKLPKVSQVFGQVLCVSRLEPGKGQDYLIRAWVSVHQQVPPSKLLIVGSGDFDSQLHALVDELSLSDTVTFLGNISDEHLSRLFAQSDICAFPSLWPLEGFGLVSLEAMAAGLPVVGFDYGPVPETVTPQTGILVPAGDVTKLAQAITKLITNRKLRHKLGTAGKRRYMDYYTFAKIGPRYAQVFAGSDSAI